VLTPSDRSRPVIAATLPVVGENIGTIAERFYEHIFAEHPDLLDGLFNRGNQAEGTQQRALAGSVAVFGAALVHHPGRLPYQLLSRVAHKHASLGLRPLVLHRRPSLVSGASRPTLRHDRRVLPLRIARRGRALHESIVFAHPRRRGVSPRGMAGR
jgi:hypothetical protein